MTDPRRSLRVAALIIVASLAWNYVLPGVVAYANGTFYEAGIEAKLPAHASTAISLYRSYQVEGIEYRRRIEAIDRRIGGTLEAGETPGELDSLIKLQDGYRSKLASLKNPINLLAYNGNLTNYYFSAAYIFLGLLIFRLSGGVRSRVRGGTVLATGVGLYVGWAAIGWLRNFVFYDQGRTIFSFANYDISRAGFLLQELRALGMFLLVAAIWQLYLLAWDDAPFETRTPNSDRDSVLELDHGAAGIGRLFARWQLCSLLLLFLSSHGRSSTIRMSSVAEIPGTFCRL